MTRLFRNVMKWTKIEPLGVTMPGRGLPRRIREIIDEPSTNRLSRTHTAAIAIACLTLCTTLFAVTLVRAQNKTTQAQSQSAASLSFEVASVKLNKSGDERAPSLIEPGGNFTATNNTVRALILNAYGIFATPYLLQGGPAWIDSARYDIDAKAATGAIPPGTSNRVLWEKTRLMLQTLLADRFKLSVHTEARQMASYELVVAKNGPKLKKSDIDCNASTLACHGFSEFNSWHLTGDGVDMYDLASLLSRFSDGPIADHTGIEGLFDIKLQWNPYPTGAPASLDVAVGDRLASLPTLPEALEENLGLKLQPIKGPVEVYVVDHIEEPSPN